MKQIEAAANICNLNNVLQNAEKGGFAVGSFSPRYTAVIISILRAGQVAKSPLIIQISQKEFNKYGITPKEFADEFYSCIKREGITVPVVLHLDHTKELQVIIDAIDAGFTSVMIDASEKKLAENIAITKEVVEYAHSFGVSVEAELGKIGTTDFVETDKDEEMYTDSEEAGFFVRETNVDALAVSVGTAHGVYLVRKPKIDFDRLIQIRTQTPVHLVLHGGSGVPANMINKAIKLPNGGISKVNIATDIELAFLNAMGLKEHMANDICKTLSKELLAKGLQGAEELVADKIVNFLGSNNKA
jgi:ketose-bisphosphate aldolase